MNEKNRVRNESILSHIELLGGGYCWEPEIFAVTLIDVSLDDSQTEILHDLVGVEQIAIDGRNLSNLALENIAKIDGLSSLVVSNKDLTSKQMERMSAFGPAIELI